MLLVTSAGNVVSGMSQSIKTASWHRNASGISDTGPNFMHQRHPTWLPAGVSLLLPMKPQDRAAIKYRKCFCFDDPLSFLSLTSTHKVLFS